MGERGGQVTPLPLLTPSPGRVGTEGGWRTGGPEEEASELGC